MLEDQAVCVQSQPRRDEEFGLGGVELIAEDGAADRVEVDADLVEAAGDGAALDQGGAALPHFRGLEGAVGGEGGLAGGGYLGELHDFLGLADGAADDPVALPKYVFAAAFVSANDNAGVVVVLASEVVKSGARSPALKFVTVPLPVSAKFNVVPANENP